MNKNETPCGELLQGKDGTEQVIIISDNVPLTTVNKIFSGEFELVPPTPWDTSWVLIPNQVCPNGCDQRSFVYDLASHGVLMEIPPEIPPDTPSFEEVFSIQN